MSRRIIFSVMPVGAVLILLGVMLDPRRANLVQMRNAILSPMGLTALFLLGWAGLSLVWTPFAPVATERFVKTAGTALLAAATAASLPAHTKTSNLYLLPVGLAAAALASFAVAIMVPAPPMVDLETSAIDRASLTLIMLMWPALAALAVRERWASAGALAVAVAIAAITVWTPIALAALALGAVTFSLATSVPKRVATTLGLLLGGLVLIAPLVPLALAPVLRASSSHFAATMQVAAQIVTAEGVRLVTGHGFDTALRSVGISYLPAATPRSALFEIWYEFGIVGALAAALLVFLAFRAAGAASRSAAPFLLSTLVCGFTIALSGLVTAQLWWFTLLTVVGVQFAIVVKGQYRTVRPAAQVFSAGSPQTQS
ncbi:MAG: conserved rane protein of unknown function [Hyphomicrobiales bacterium]|nr:conserved rane protein of unknown function [Hyphomicrobiales bacterium]